MTRHAAFLRGVNALRLDDHAVRSLWQSTDGWVAALQLASTGKTYDLGVSSFITKPVTFTSLVGMMKTLSDYWFEIVELPPTLGA